jgi:quercetin dioxygenase-like cupin family protein
MSGYRHGAGGGETYDWRGALVTLKATGTQTLGQLAVMEFSYPPGLAVPAHVHVGEDEMFYILAGEQRAFCDDAQWTVGPGEFVFVPLDRPHGSDRPIWTVRLPGPLLKTWPSPVIRGNDPSVPVGSICVICPV